MKHNQNQVLNEVIATGSSASVTRRSAGLPLIVQSIVASESKTKQSCLLSLAISELLQIVGQAVPDDADQQKDLPQVHALNILKAVFREASVSVAAMPYLAPALQHTIQGFSSPNWGIRNGATQLFGTLVQRMVGQKKTRDDRLNTVTTQEFFALYPSLQSFLLQHLQSATSGHQSKNLGQHPSLFPVLTLLARLSGGIEDNDNSLREFRVTVKGLSASPIYAVRELAAKALVPLVPHSELQSVLQNLVTEIPETPLPCQCHNKLHGTVLQLKRLIQDARLPISDMADIWTSLGMKCWMASEKNACHLLRGCYIELMMALTEQLKKDLPESLLDMLETQTGSLISGDERHCIQIGYGRYVTPVLTWLYKVHSNNLEKVKAALNGPQVEVTLATLDFLKDQVKKSSADAALDKEYWSSVQDCLFGLACSSEQPWSVLCGSLEVILAIHESASICFWSGHVETVWQHMMDHIQREANSQPAASALAISGILIAHNTEALRLFECSRQLLSDDHAYIREEAAIFVQRLAKLDTQTPINSSVALELLHTTLQKLTGSTPGMLTYLVSSMEPQKKVAEILAEEINRTTEDLFEPEDGNPYQENIIQLQLLSATFQHYSEYPELSQAECCRICDSFHVMVADLEATLEMLQEHCQGMGLLNLSCHPAILGGLWGYVLLCQIPGVCDLATATVRSHVAMHLHQVLVSLAQVQHLHPALQTAATRAASIWETT